MLLCFGELTESDYVYMGSHSPPKESVQSSSLILEHNQGINGVKGAFEMVGLVMQKELKPDNSLLETDHENG